MHDPETDLRNPIKYNRFINIFHSPFTAWNILFLSLIFTFFAYYISNNFAKQQAEDRFEYRADEIIDAIIDRMNVYEEMLRGGVALFNASEEVTREEWKIYVDTLAIGVHWPGVQGLGFSIPVKPEEKQAHIDKIRAEGFPEFTIKPEGERDMYSSIIYLEPFDWRNQRAFGYDMWSNDMRREAMTRARDQGVAATSGVITLVQETDKDVQKGFLTYLPVYKRGMPTSTAEERRQAFQGWVYSPFRMGDLMQGVLGTKDPSIEFEVYDGNEIKPEALLYDSNNVLSFNNINNNSEFKITKRILLQGRPWTVYVSSAKGYFSEGEQKQPKIVAVGAVIVDVLLFFLIYSIYFLHKKAVLLTEEMSQEVKQKVVELERSNKDLEQFAYVASHDLQEPVRKMVSYSQLFEQRFKDVVDEDGKKYINFIVSGAKRMQVLIQDLLKYARVGQGDWRFESVAMDEVVKEAMLNLEQTISENNAKIMFDHLPEVSVNKLYMVQLFQNLIGNAIKYRGEQDPVVEISSQKEGDYYIFSISDNGIGIDKEYLDKIFVIFERLHGDADYEGTGIGLALCKRIIDQHGGEIWAESKGEGTTFKFKLKA